MCAARRPDNDPVVLHDYTESSAQINALIDENRRVPDFRVPGLEREAQPAQNVQPTYTPPVQAECAPRRSLLKRRRPTCRWNAKRWKRR